MATIRQSALEDLAGYVSEVEAERDSYRDEAAEWKLKYQAAVADLQRLRATMECDPLCDPQSL